VGAQVEWQILTRTTSATRRWTDLETLQRIFDALVEGCDDGIIVLDRQMRVRLVNEACLRVLGRMESEKADAPLRCNELIGCHDRYGQLFEAPNFCPVHRLFGEHPPPSVEQEVMIRDAEGHETWLGSRYFPVKDKTGRVEFAVGILRDVSQRQALEEQLLESRKLAAFGVLTAGIAHELNTPLGVLRSAAEIIATAESSEQEKREAAEFIKSETMRLDRTIRAFLAYARPNPPELLETDINELVDDSIQFFQARKDRTPDVRIEKQLAENLPRCWADAGQMQNVFGNLLLNAEQVVGKGGVIRIITERQGEWVRVEVADSGRGIEPAEVERIFDPFYTTRPEASGLGLAVVRRTVTEHRGRIRVQRSSLGGASLAVYLPVHPAERPIPVERDTGPALPGTGSSTGSLRPRGPQKGT
jgi:signal transduction histidine kinase